MTANGTAQAKLEVVIIGAGLSGLSAAISCAQAGHDVLVLEGARELAEVRDRRRDVHNCFQWLTLV